MTRGSCATTDDPATESDLVVERLQDAGFVLCGRTNASEFGTITSTENDRYGITRNPWNLDRTPGGSCGGASAAVSGGMFTIAQGGDGGGSIRIPASCTGLVGLKAARARIPSRTAPWEGADTDGVVTRTVADTAAVLHAIGRPDPLAWWNAPAPLRPFADEVGAGRERHADHERHVARAADRLGLITPHESQENQGVQENGGCYQQRETGTDLPVERLAECQISGNKMSKVLPSMVSPTARCSWPRREAVTAVTSSGEEVVPAVVSAPAAIDDRPRASAMGEVAVPIT